MNLYQFFKRNYLWTHGRELLYVVLGLILIGLVYTPVALWISGGLCAFGLFFYRNPVRVRPDVAPGILLCPADGTVVAITEEPGKYTTIAIFLSPFNVHVNWIPCDGTITAITHRPGACYPAFVPKSSELNESVTVNLQSSYGPAIAVRQIAGTLARRIVWWISAHETIDAGQSYGMIKFGSRVELTVPATATILVYVGQKVRGVETSIAQLA